MGSYPYPRGGIVKVDYENILLFKKQGNAPSVNNSTKEASRLTDNEWNTCFSSHWTFPGARQSEHIAVFPEELPKRLIKMFSFVGDTVCDPFMGSGMTAAAANKYGREFLGFIFDKNCYDRAIKVVDEINRPKRFEEIKRRLAEMKAGN